MRHFGIRSNISRLQALLGGISIGKRSVIRTGAKVSRIGGGNITIGDECEIKSGAKLLTHGGDIRLGNHCSVQHYSILYGHGGLTIGNYVRIAAHCVIVPSNHIFDDATRPIHEQGNSMKGVVIEDDVWLGAGVRVLDGAHISEGCVIAAGAVVTAGKTEPYSIYGGVPARLLRTREKI